MKAVVSAFFCLFSSLALALEPGERLAPWTLLDQYEVPYTLNEQTRILLVARDMEGARLLDTALQGRPKGYLEQRHAVFLADISRMPGVIASLFALPKMRDYNYRVVLDRHARIAPRYPVGEGEVAWLQLEDGRLLEQRGFSEAVALAEALAAAGP